MYLVTMADGYRIATACSRKYQGRPEVETIEFMKNMSKAIGMADSWR